MTETGERSDREGTIYLDPLQGTNKSTCVDEVRVMNFSERRGVFCNPFSICFSELSHTVLSH